MAWPRSRPPCRFTSWPAIAVGGSVESSSGRLVVNPGARELDFDRVVALPALAGPDITGLPADADGFLPIGSDCQVSDAHLDELWADGLRWRLVARAG